MDFTTFTKLFKEFNLIPIMSVTSLYGYLYTFNKFIYLASYPNMHTYTGCVKGPLISINPCIVNPLDLLKKANQVIYRLKTAN